MALPGQAAGPAGRDRARAVLRRDLPRLHPGLPVLPGRHDHPPVRERSIETIGAMVENGIRMSGFEEVGVLSLSSADHSEIGEVAKDLADRYEGQNVFLSLPSTRVDAFNVTLADEFSATDGVRADLRARGRQRADAQGDQQGRLRGGPDPHGRHGVRARLAAGQALLHVRAPDGDRRARPEIADLATKVIAEGREVTGRNDIRCTVSIGGFVPKPHTPFQWAAQLDDDTTDDWLRQLRDKVRADKRYGRAIGFRPRRQARHHRRTLSRGDRRVGRVIEKVWRDGGASTAGASTSRTTDWSPRPRRPRRHGARP